MRVQALLLVVLAIVGCTTTSDVMRLDETPRAPTPLSDVSVLVEEPLRPYSVIAMVEASDQGWDLSLEKLKRTILREAAALGGEAVILGTSSSPSGTAFVPIGKKMDYGFDQVEKRLLGKVIVYTGDQ